MEITRQLSSELLACSQSYPIVTIIGPRQSGKTTLVKMTFPNKPYVNLEDPDIRHLALTDPRQFLEQYPDGAILDEIQRLPELLSYLQGIVDNRDTTGLFILTGSHQLSLQAQITQSLAGRTGVLQLLPLSLTELMQNHLQHTLDEQLFYGFYPRIYKHQIEPHRFYRDYVQTYIERDVRLLVNIKDLDQFQRFLRLCTTRIGQLIDYTQLANELGISRHTIKEWISILKASFVITTLPPYFESLGKRIVKSSKLYFVDVGLACYLLGIQDPVQLSNHPLRGYLFENLIINEVTKSLFSRGEEANLYFYRDSNQLEVDLILPRALSMIAIEIKAAKSFHSEFLRGLSKFKDLVKNHTVRNYLIYTGEHQQKVHDVTLLNYQNTEKVVSS